MIRALDISGQRPGPDTTAGRHADRLRHHEDQRAVNVEYDVPIAGNGWTGCARRSRKPSQRTGPSPRPNYLDDPA